MLSKSRWQISFQNIKNKTENIQIAVRHLNPTWRLINETSQPSIANYWKTIENQYWYPVKSIKLD